MPQGLNPRLFMPLSERLQSCPYYKTAQIHAAGVETPPFYAIIGTTKSLPFQDSDIQRVFPQPLKSCPDTKLPLPVHD
jgi:hypothetical protein